MVLTHLKFLLEKEQDRNDMGITHWGMGLGDKNPSNTKKTLKTMKYFWRLCPGFVGAGLI